MKIGDRVTVYRKVKKNPSPWVSPQMDYTVGLSGVICGFMGNCTLVTLDNENLFWWYPRSSLKYEASK